MQFIYYYTVCITLYPICYNFVFNLYAIHILLYSFVSYQDGGRNPVYKIWEFGYQQRIEQECDVELTELSYNCGKNIQDTPWNYGIFVGEFNNQIQNHFETAKSKHHLMTALQELPMCKAVINYKTFRQHLVQSDIMTIHKTKFPNCKTNFSSHGND